MTKPVFKAGDLVRRINFDNSSRMTVGSEWVVAATRKYRLGCDLALRGYGNEVFSSNSDNFELVVPPVSLPSPIEANFEIPQAEINTVLSDHFSRKLGIKVEVTQLFRPVFNMHTMAAQVSPL